MSQVGRRNRILMMTGLGIAVLIAVLLSPLASRNPDGLDRVAQDHKLETKTDGQPLAHQLPFYQVFEEYTMRGVPAAIATPLAGLVGTLVTFGIAWGMGKLVVRQPNSPPDDSP